MTFDNEDQRELILEALQGVSYPGKIVERAAAVFKAVREAPIVKPEDDGPASS